MKFKNLKTNVAAATIVRLIVLLIALANLGLSLFGTYQIPSLTEDTQNALALVITAVIALVSYWYNNSWSENATTADKVLQILKESDITIDDVLGAVNDLQEQVNASKEEKLPDE